MRNEASNLENHKLNQSKSNKTVLEPFDENHRRVVGDEW